ncbi:rod shape-determining protein MreC [Catonella sp.]|uniref:rod shape-determining protein MreC n=1 Tax=Catonella sp. TaxID=2382125 RepID=UPI003FA066B4
MVLLVASYRFSDKLGPVKTVAGDLITPMQVGINEVGSYFTAKLDYLKNVDDLLAKNKELTEKLDKVNYENKLLIQGKYELDDFRKLYNLDQTYADYPKVAARVISKDTNNWYSNFKIDKGTNDGIKPGMNVMAGNGLVGIIIKADHNNSIVRSIIDDSSNVRGMFLDTSDTCTVKGNLKLLDEGHIEVTDIKKGSGVKDGYEVVTSYVSPKFHPGILIGYVSNIKVDPSNMTESGYLTPAVDFSKLDMVLIITREKEELY